MGWGGDGRLSGSQGRRQRERERKRGNSAGPALCSQARPLTRYLPIRKEDFDLKTHIESSGHGVDTCLHVVLSSKVQGMCGLGVLGGEPHGQRHILGLQKSDFSSCPNTGGLRPRTWCAGLKGRWGQPP